MAPRNTKTACPNITSRARANWHSSSSTPFATFSRAPNCDAMSVNARMGLWNLFMGGLWQRAHRQKGQNEERQGRGTLHTGILERPPDHVESASKMVMDPKFALKKPYTKNNMHSTEVDMARQFKSSIMVLEKTNRSRRYMEYPMYHRRSAKSVSEKRDEDTTHLRGPRW